MITLVDKSVKVDASADLAQFPQCPDSVYDAWIKRVHANGTHVNVGEKYLWLYAQLLPPSLVNCIITVREGDEYPKGV